MKYNLFRINQLCDNNFNVKFHVIIVMLRLNEKKILNDTRINNFICLTWMVYESQRISFV